MVLVVAAALGFAFSNGFHDTFDVISTGASARAAPPQAAIAAAALLNFAGAFISMAVAATIAQDVVDAASITPSVVFAGLLGAIAWNLATWRFRLPSSSSHALIGGLLGASIAAAGTDAGLGSGGLDKGLIPALLAPPAAFLLAGCAIAGIYPPVGRRRPGPGARSFRPPPLVSGSLLARAHRAHGAKKRWGVTARALTAKASPAAAADPPLWAIVGSAVAISLGTYSGGLRVMRGGGRRIIEMDAAQGFSAQGAGAATILAATFLGFPISSTHAISGGVMGAGAAKRVSAVRWGVAGNIVAAWLLTLPAAAAIGAAAYGIAWAFGAGAQGPSLK